MEIFNLDFSETVIDLLKFVAILLALVLQQFIQRTFIQKSLISQSEKLQTFTDVSVRKLNGTATSIIRAFPAPCYMMILDEQDGNSKFIISEVNEAYENITGIKRSNAIGNTELEIGVIKSDAEENHKHNLLVCGGPEPNYTFDEVIKPESKEKIKIMKVRLVSVEGKIKGILAFVVEPKFCCPFWNPNCLLKDVPGIFNGQ